MNSLSTDSPHRRIHASRARASAKSTTGAIAIGINTRDGDVGRRREDFTRDTRCARAKRRDVERFLDLIKVDFFTLLHTNDDTFSHARSPASTRREALTHDGRRGREFRTKRRLSKRTRDVVRDATRTPRRGENRSRIGVSEEIRLRQASRLGLVETTLEDIVDGRPSRGRRGEIRVVDTAFGSLRGENDESSAVQTRGHGSVGTNGCGTRRAARETRAANRETLTNATRAFAVEGCTLGMSGRR